MKYVMWVRGGEPYSGRTMMLRAGQMILLLMLSLAAWAQDTADPSAAPASRHDFLALDRNRDGHISKVEALANAEVQKRFAAFDRDRDGRLSEAEHAAAMQDNEKRIL